MSIPNVTRKTNKITPSFPTEIWLDIFDWATFIPNVFDTHAPDVFAYPAPWTVEQIQEGLRQTLSMKRNIVRVCKAWNALATRFLYQAIILRCAKSMKRLLRTLSATASTDINLAQASPTPGLWTRRLDFSNYTNYEMSHRDLEKLLSILPNLEIFVLRNYLETFSPGLAVFDILAAMTTRSLRVLDIVANYEMPFRSHMVPDIVLSRQPLHILRVAPCFSVDARWMQALIPHIQFIYATSKMVENGLLSGHHTSLSGISIFNAPSYASLYSHSMFAPYLTTLEVDFLHASSAVLLSLITASPNLRNLIVDVAYVRTISSCHNLPPISNIGLKITRTSEGRLSKQDWKVLCGNLLRLVEQKPNVKVVRFLGKPNPQDLARHHAGTFKIICQTSASLFSERKIRFEDRAGCLFHDVPAPV